MPGIGSAPSSRHPVAPSSRPIQSSGPGRLPPRNSLDPDPTPTTAWNGTRRVTTVTNVFATPHKGTGAAASAGHEQVTFCQDMQSGLHAIVAIYSTALGPALGGTRFYPYPSEDDALADVLNLARAMAYKNALAGLDHGGGKAVIIGDPDTGQVRGAAARLRPVRQVARRALHHRLRRRDLQRGHGHHRPRVPLRHRPHRAARRRGRLLAAHRLRRVPGHARGGRARLGNHRAAWPPRRRSKAWARSATGSWSNWSRPKPTS